MDEAIKVLCGVVYRRENKFGSSLPGGGIAGRLRRRWSLMVNLFFGLSCSYFVILRETSAATVKRD
jgi:hypothetical protein